MVMTVVIAEAESGMGGACFSAGVVICIIKVQETKRLNNNSDNEIIK